MRGHGFRVISGPVFRVAVSAHEAYGYLQDLEFFPVDDLLGLLWFFKTRLALAAI